MVFKDEADGLGIHPALAKRYREKNSLAPQENEQPASFVGDVLPPPPTRVLASDEDPGRTNPGRLLGRRHSIEGAPVAESVRAPPPHAPNNEGEPVELMPIVPGYACTELVGKGAMGRVYRATANARGHRMAAIKILAPELAARADFIARFEREGAAMRAVQHPGVVAVLDAGAARQRDGSTAHYISMEFIEGPPLRRHLDRGALSPERALRYARLIIQGLGAAHARGVIHRDLKPENILAPPDPTGGEHDRLVLVDFGLAGILDEHNDPHPNLTKSRMTMGTVNYMAPEQRTDAKRVDQRADLYAAGVILYELLTGDLPLGRFALPTERAVPVPPSVDRCIVRALARNPDERYQDAAEFDADLRAIEDEMRKSVGRDTVLGRVGPSGGTSNRRAIVADLLTGGLLAAGDGATAWAPALPFIKRPLLYWSAGALLLCAVLGVLGLVAR